MDLVLVLLISLSLSGLCWFYLSFRRMDIPIETTETIKYALTAMFSDAVFCGGWILEKLGICSQVKLLKMLLMAGVIRGEREVHIRDEQFANVPVRIYEPKHPFDKPRRCIIYIHGGVGMLGTIRSYTKVCRNFVLRTSTMVVDIGYRLAPEHPHPAQVEDCISAVVHLLKEAKHYGVDPNRIIVAGDSSGGTIASVVCHHLVPRKDLPRIRALLMIYPVLQLIDATLPSYQQNTYSLILNGKRVIQLATHFVTSKAVDINAFLRNAHVPDHLSVKYKKWISPKLIPDEFKVRGYVPIAPAPFSEELHKLSALIFQEDLCPLLAKDDVIRQLPETFLLTCEYDVLRDDGLLYKKRLEDNGVPVTWVHLEKGFHGIMFKNDFIVFDFKEAKKGMEHIVEFIQRC